jgi:hypothetical protein
MAVTLDFATDANMNTSNADIGLTIGNLDNTLLLVGYGQHRQTTDASIGAQSISFGGDALTSHTTIDGTFRTSLDVYKLVSPAIGAGTLNIQRNTSDAEGPIQLIIASFGGVDADTLFTGEAEFASTAVTNMSSDTLAASAGSFVFDIGMISAGDSNSNTLVMGTDSTLGAQREITTTNSYLMGGSYRTAPAGTTLMNWSWTGSAPYVHWLAEISATAVGRARSIKYFFDMYDPDGRILDEQGRTVPPWEIEPDSWMRVTGLFLPTSTKYGTFTQDPELAYIEEVKYSTRGGLRIKTNRGELTEVLLARAAGGKTL